MKVVLKIKHLVVLNFILFGTLSFSQNLEGSFESKFKRYQKNQQFEGDVCHTSSIVVWKGERTSQQIILWSKKDKLNTVTYSVSNFTNNQNSIASSNINLRFGNYVKGNLEAKPCASYPQLGSYVEIADALSEEYINSIQPNDPIKLWLTVDIPKNTTTGDYFGTITVKSGTEQLIFSLYITVVDDTLPDVKDWEYHLDLWQFPLSILNHYNKEHPTNTIEAWSDNHFTLLEPFYRLLADSGQKTITTYIKDNALGAPSMIQWIRKADDSWEYDYSAFDTYVAKLMSWGITKQISCFSPVGWNEETIPFWDEQSNSTIHLNAPLESEIFRTRWNHFLTDFKKHLDAKGWFDKTVLFLDEVTEDKLNNVITTVRNNHPGWKLGIAHSKNFSMNSKAQFYDVSGILEEATSFRLPEQKIATFYTSCTQVRPNNYVTPDSNPADMTWMSWYAFQNNFDGYLRWAFDFGTLSDPFDHRDGSHTSGDYAMVYRSSNNFPSTVLSSIRFELLREGIQDYEKLRIIKNRLQSSRDLDDKLMLNSLNTTLNKFDISSGYLSESLVIEGQKAIADISQGNYSYCNVSGKNSKEYYIKSINSTGGIKNINFSNNQYPVFGYTYHTASKISAVAGDIISITIDNSAKSKCAKTQIWIDWNNDKDFDDFNENIFIGGNLDSCNNDVSYTVVFQIPLDASQGKKRTRIQVKSATDSTVTPCGNITNSNTVDLDIDILESYCPVTGSGVYNANLVTTKRGIKNIEYSGTSGENNYVDSSEELIARQSDEIELAITNSNGWSRSIVWIDWNGDRDFKDLGERLKPFGPEKESSGSLPISYKTTLTVPSNAILGTHKIRIVTGDAWTYEDSNIPVNPCNNSSSDNLLPNAAIKDFNITIKKPNTLGIVEHKKPLHLFWYPNPVRKKITINSYNLNNKEVIISIYNSKNQISHYKKIPSFKSPQSVSIPKKLSRGVYFLNIKSEGISYQSKMIIQ